MIGIRDRQRKTERRGGRGERGEDVGQIDCYERLAGKNERLVA